VQYLLETALSNPWGTLEYVLDGPLHPGGEDHTTELFDRAGVTDGTRVLDAGCGAGRSVELAHDRGAVAVGLDRNPPPDGIRGDLSALPIQEGSLDVVLAECVMCLVPDRERALAEARRTLRPGGRLALSDVIVEGEVPDVPPPVAEAFCLSNSTSREELREAVERAGFELEDTRDHRENLLAMRDRLCEQVEYETLLPAFGDRGRELLEAIETLEAAVEAGDVGYVSLVGKCPA